MTAPTSRPAATSISGAVLEILGDALGEEPETFDAETILASRGWDSIASLEALAQLESRFSISLDLRSFHSAHTVAQMVELIETAVAAR